MTERGPLAPWPDPPPGSKPPRSTRMWLALRALRRGGWFRPRRLGCLLVVLLVALVLVLWALGAAVNGTVAMFRNDPAPVPGGPFDSVAPPRPAGSGSPTLDRITKRGLLIVAVKQAPGLAEQSFGTLEYWGFEVELLHLVVNDLGLDPGDIRFKPLTPAAQDQALEELDADIAIGGIQLTPQRRARGGFVGPDMVTQVRMAVPAKAAGAMPDIDGTVCAQKGSAAAAAVLAERMGERLTTSGSLDACVDLIGNRISALAGKPVGAVAADETALRALPQVKDGSLREVGEPLGSVEYGIAVPPGDEVFRERVSAVLRRAIEDGTWARLYEQYLGTPVPAPPAPPR